MAKPGEVLIKEGEVLEDFETLTPDLVNPSLQITYKRCDGFNETITGTATFEICTKDPSSTTFDTRFWKVERIGPCEDSDGPDFPPDTPGDPNCKRFRVTQTDSRISRTTLNYTDNKLVKQSIVLTFGETVTVDATDKFEEEVRTRENRGALTIEPLGTCSEVDKDKDPEDDKDKDKDRPDEGLQVLKVNSNLPNNFKVEIASSKISGLITLPVELEGTNIFQESGINYRIGDVPVVTNKTTNTNVNFSILDIQVSIEGTAQTYNLVSPPQQNIETAAELIDYVSRLVIPSPKIINLLFIFEAVDKEQPNGSPFGNTDDTVNQPRRRG